MKQFLISLGICTSWVGFSGWLAYPWYSDVATVLGAPVALLVIFLIALIPGAAMAFVYGTVFIDRDRIKSKVNASSLRKVTVLVAAYNEQNTIVPTLRSISEQKFSCDLEVIVCNDGSIDNTSHITSEYIVHNKLTNFKMISSDENVGKANILNMGLVEATGDIIVTVDADTILSPGALQSLVNTLEHSDAVAVAGTVLVKNSKKNWLTRIQEWDYLIGISAVKQAQAAYDHTLVAQGAFSAYYKDKLQSVLGWTDTVGEDIVLTWKLLEQGHRVTHDPDAVVYTNVPETYGQFFRQRKRWSAGLVESFKTTPSIIFRREKGNVFVWYNAMFPLLDFSFLFIFVPSVIAAVFFQYYLLVGLITLLLLPLAMAVMSLMYFRQKRILERNNLKMPKRNLLGLVLFVVTYQLLQAPATLSGYATEIFNLKKTWGTK